MNHKLLVMYIVFLVPLVLTLFFKAIKENKIIFLIPAAIISSLFSVVLIGFPWLFGYIISSLGPVLYIFSIHPKRFLQYSFTLISLLFVMNIYWIFHFVYALLFGNPNSNFSSGILTQEFRRQTVDTILSVTNQNTLYHSILGFFNPNLQKNFEWITYKIYENWHSKFIVINICILLFICTVALYYRRNKSSALFPFALFGWLISVYFFTVNMFGTYGIRLFLRMNETIPAFSMFRNNYDKFASGYAFAFAFLLFATSREISINKKFPQYFKKLWIFLLFTFVLVTTIPTIQGNFERQLLASTQNTKVKIDAFDPSFLNFASKLKELNIDRIIWMPLNKASYVIVQDHNKPEHVFAGISPITYLSNVHDYSGIVSFRDKETKLILEAIENQDSDAFGNILKELGITHIALNNTISSDIKNSYLFGTDFFEKQNGEFLNSILGEEVILVDSAYSLRKIKDKYYQEIFYFESNCEVTNIELSSRDQYTVSYKSLENTDSESCTLFFKYPYSKLWELTVNNKLIDNQPTALQQNSWEVPAIDNTIIISFKPRRYVNTLITISIVSIISSAVYFAIYITKHD